MGSEMCIRDRDIRDEARSKKDFQLSDSIRDQLLKLGIRINDKD